LAQLVQRLGQLVLLELQEWPELLVALELLEQLVLPVQLALPVVQAVLVVPDLDLA
jgi:hypothetical protein